MKYRKETGGMAKTGPKVVRPVKQKTLRKTSARKAKPEPTPKEVEEHNKSHLPYASWCKICISAKAKEDAHRQRKDVVADPLQLPLVEMDYTIVDTAAILVAVAENHGYGMAIRCLMKGAVSYSVGAIQRFLMESGMSSGIRLRTDQEPAVMALAQKIASHRKQVLSWRLRL